MPFLLLNEADSTSLALRDANTLALLKQFEMPGRVAVLGISASGRYAFAVHRDDHMVTIIDSHSQTLIGSVTTGEQPTHFHAHDDLIVIFNDGSGSVSIFRESLIAQGDLTPQTVTVTQADHGSAVLIDGLVLAGHLRLGQVDVYQADGSGLVQTFDCCPVLHGVAQAGQTAIFGCADGVLLVKKQGDHLTSVKLDNPPDSPARTRVGLFATHPQSALVLGNFGAGVALIDPLNDTMEILPLAGGHLIKFAFDKQGKDAFALTVDGTLQHLDLQERRVKQLAKLVEEVAPPKGPDGKPRPSFAVGEAAIYLIAPDEKILMRVDSATLITQQSLQLDHAPTMIVYLAG